MKLRMDILTHDERAARRRAQQLWHGWFAWHPVSVPHVGIVWLEHVQRRQHSGYNGSWYEYSEGGADV